MYFFDVPVMLLYLPLLSILLILYFTRSSATYSHGLLRKDEYCIFFLTKIATNFLWHIVSLSKNWIQLSLKWIPWLCQRPKVIHLDKLVTFKMLLVTSSDPNTYLVYYYISFFWEKALFVPRVCHASFKKAILLQKMTVNFLHGVLSFRHRIFT